MALKNFLSQIIAKGGIRIPTGSATRSVLVSDAEGNASWRMPNESFTTQAAVLAGNVVEGSEHTITTPANTLVSFRSQFSATWNSSTEGGAVWKLERDGVAVVERNIKLAPAGTSYGHASILMDFIQSLEGSHTWKVVAEGYGTEHSLALQVGILTFVP